ncbi:mono/diheme cytochrome c family protein [Pararhizobium capsulatum DSM 1112]|uniref:Mono/diheme cytochrome c family protein n=1 Tax=Pararhizobium capsulatum DSM 1112 TaxID=1121113 RepID=A0ABU0BZ61_9HYPH|nr:c-type cytochrome [Pararhizobium capsulatum]MDQ0322730.1 mono/diheme cytochrome c family protein [Pararhizobium capsulatum DSM 1112]
MSDRHGLFALAAMALITVSPAPALAADHGKDMFVAVCEACHGEGGVGTEGVAPPLVDPALWSRLGDKAPTYIAGVLAGGLSGKISANGIDYIGLVMPPQTEAGSLEELTAVANYVLKDLNGLGSFAHTATIDAALKAPQAHKQLRAMREGH